MLAETEAHAMQKEEPSDTHERDQNQTNIQDEAATVKSSSPTQAQGAYVPQTAGTCAACGTRVETNSDGNPDFVYALGRVDVRFPSLGTEKEIAQVTGRAATSGLTDRQALHNILSERDNRYIVHQLCWILTVEGVETYILRPRHPNDFDLLVDALRPAPRATDVDVVIGVRGPVAPPEVCNGLMIPMALFAQMYSFDIDGLVKSVPRPEKTQPKTFHSAVEELLMRIIQMADNAGASDEHRALNYLAVRYPAIYATAAEAYSQNRSLASVSVRTSRLSGTRKIVDVIFSYTHRETDVTDRYFVRVDVTEEFPFLVTKISPYYVYDQYP